MDIEILVRVGDRMVDDNGRVSWENVKSRSCLVTYFHDTEGAKEEAMMLAEDALSSVTSA